MSLNLVKCSCLTVFIFLTAMSNLALAGSVGGSDGAGGGNVNSDENYSAYTNYNRALTDIKAAFESKEIQNTVAAFADSRLYSIISDQSSAEERKAKLLAEQGLASEILNSTYAFKEKCFEQNVLATGKIELLETDASTLRGVKLAEICLSKSRLVRRLAQNFQDGKNEFYNKLKGLIYHENARHFLLPGENDTEYLTTEDGERFRIQPLALYVQNHSFLQQNARMTQLNDGAYLSWFSKFEGYNSFITPILIGAKNREALTDIFLVAHYRSGKDCKPGGFEIALDQANVKMPNQEKFQSHISYIGDFCSNGVIEIVNKRTNERMNAGVLKCGSFESKDRPACNLQLFIYGSYNLYDLKWYGSDLKLF